MSKLTRWVGRTILGAAVFAAGSSLYAQQPGAAPGGAAAGAPGGAAAGPAKRVATVKIFKTNRAENPEFNMRPKGPPQPNRNWTQILTEYDIEPEWQDQLEITYYALVKNTREPKGPPQILLKCTSTYLNLKKGRHRSEAYVHPSVFERWGDIEAKAVVFTAGGQIVAGESDPPARTKWWEKLTPTDGLMVSGRDSPFALAGTDEFEAVKRSSP
jgi:hypothetical protein